MPIEQVVSARMLRITDRTTSPRPRAPKPIFDPGIESLILSQNALLAEQWHTAAPIAIILAPTQTSSRTRPTIARGDRLRYDTRLCAENR